MLCAFTISPLSADDGVAKKIDKLVARLPVDTPAKKKEVVDALVKLGVVNALGGAGEGTDLKLVPIIFTITYVEDDGATRTQSLHRLVAMTTNQDAVQAAGEEVE